MNRDLMLLYLKEVRDLEFAIWKLKRNYQIKKSSYTTNRSKLSKVDYITVPNYYIGWPTLSIVGCVLFSVCTILSLVILIFGTDLVTEVNGNRISYNRIPAYQSDLANLLVPMIFLFALFAISIFVFTKKSVDTQNTELTKEREEAIKYNEEMKIIEESNKKELMILESRMREYNIASSKEQLSAEKLLKDYYSLNILPNPYRNLASVYYIYDYMSSSNATLEETLFHEHMENGIQRILAKLDTIINQNNTVILQNRQIEATNQEILRVNMNMLNRLQSIETNTETAAQYAELASNYSAANAFFSAAQYLK